MHPTPVPGKARGGGGGSLPPVTCSGTSPPCTRSLPPDTAPSLLMATSVGGGICPLARVKLLTPCPRQASTGWHVVGYWCASAETGFESTPCFPALLRCHSEGRVTGNANPAERLTTCSTQPPEPAHCRRAHGQGGQTPPPRPPARPASAQRHICGRMLEG